MKLTQAVVQQALGSGLTMVRKQTMLHLVNAHKFLVTTKTAMKAQQTLVDLKSM
jgi:hypothetical protein